MGAHPQNSAKDDIAPVVAIVEDDGDMRAAMDSLFRSVGLVTRLFASACDFLDTSAPEDADCLVVDVLMPRMSGLDFQTRLIERGVTVPIVFVTGFGDVPMAVRAVKAGAFDVLTKPFRDQELLDAVMAAIAQHRSARQAASELEDLRARHASLTAREAEVMALVTEGLMNKEIAARLGISEVTVKLHRGKMLRKMEVRSVADLVRIADALRADAV